VNISSAINMRSFSGDDKHSGNNTSHLMSEQEQQQHEERLSPYNTNISQIAHR
jgi:hypothetical protein